MTVTTCAMCGMVKKCTRMHVETVVGPEWVVRGQVRKSPRRHARELRIKAFMESRGLRDAPICTRCYYGTRKNP